MRQFDASMRTNFGHGSSRSITRVCARKKTGQLRILRPRLCGLILPLLYSNYDGPQFHGVSLCLNRTFDCWNGDGCPRRSNLNVQISICGVLVAMNISMPNEAFGTRQWKSLKNCLEYTSQWHWEYGKALCREVVSNFAIQKNEREKTLIVLGIYIRIVPSFLPAVNQTPYAPDSHWLSLQIFHRFQAMPNPSKASVEHFELCFTYPKQKNQISQIVILIPSLIYASSCEAREA